MNDDEIHAGYEFEEGMLSRIRSWVDLAPWLRLVRVLRILAAPLHVAIVSVASLATVLLFGALGGGRLRFESRWSFDAWLGPLIELWVSAGWWNGGILLVGLVLIWMPAIQSLARSGASLTADRGLPASRETLKLVYVRLWKSFLVPLVPMLCVLVLAAGLLLIRLPIALIGIPWLSWATGCFLGVLTIPLGILAFGAVFAVPLGSAAMACESDPDPIDSLSRGYEYLFRRPLHLIWYVAFSAGLSILACWMIDGVAFSAIVIVRGIAVAVSPDVTLISSATATLALLMFSWKASLTLALLGGVYLLLRRDANGQDVEDFWQPAKPAQESLPTLPPEAYQT